jgi:hypothetical protein
MAFGCMKSPKMVSGDIREQVARCRISSASFFSQEFDGDLSSKFWGKDAGKLVSLSKQSKTQTS